MASEELAPYYVRLVGPKENTLARVMLTPSAARWLGQLARELNAHAPSADYPRMQLRPWADYGEESPGWRDGDD